MFWKIALLSCIFAFFTSVKAAQLPPLRTEVDVSPDVTYSSEPSLQDQASQSNTADPDESAQGQGVNLKRNTIPLDGDVTATPPKKTIDELHRIERSLKQEAMAQDTIDVAAQRPTTQVMYLNPDKPLPEHSQTPDVQEHSRVARSKEYYPWHNCKKEPTGIKKKCHPHRRAIPKRNINSSYQRQQPSSYLEKTFSRQPCQNKFSQDLGYNCGNFMGGRASSSPDPVRNKTSHRKSSAITSDIATQSNTNVSDQTPFYKDPNINCGTASDPQCNKTSGKRSADVPQSIGRVNATQANTTVPEKKLLDAGEKDGMMHGRIKNISSNQNVSSHRNTSSRNIRALSPHEGDTSNEKVVPGEMINTYRAQLPNALQDPLIPGRQVRSQIEFSGGTTEEIQNPEIIPDMSEPSTMMVNPPPLAQVTKETGAEGK